MDIKEFYAQFMNENSLVFDIGANLGNRTDTFAALARHVVAVEPQEHCCNILRIHHQPEKVSIVGACCGEKIGTAKLRQIDPQTQWNCISSLSDRWIEAVTKEKRFGEVVWDKEIEVPMITLDALIEKYGSPDFIKIDVEGYEPEVIRGLNKPVKCFSFEFTPSTLSMVAEVFDHVKTLEPTECNYSLGEDLDFSLEQWVDPATLYEKLHQYQGDNIVFGDVYVRAI